METQIYRQAPGGSHSYIYIMPMKHHFLKEQDKTSTYRHTYIHTHTRRNGNNTGLPLSQPFGSREKESVKMSERAKKKPRMRCVIQPRHGGLGQQGDQESLPIVNTCHTQACMHARRAEKAGSSTAKPNMLQHLPKKSENECKLRLFSPPHSLTTSHLLSSHPRL